MPILVNYNFHLKVLNNHPKKDTGVASHHTVRRFFTRNKEVFSDRRRNGTEKELSIKCPSGGEDEE
jgi:hypothetical protein